MGYYRTALICVNGHTITDSVDTHPQRSEKFCSKCAAPTISQCPSCTTNIRGDYFVEGSFVYRGGYKPPAFCYNCSKPFPWTESKLESAKVLLELSDLGAKEQSNF